MTTGERFCYQRGWLDLTTGYAVLKKCGNAFCPLLGNLRGGYCCSSGCERPAEILLTRLSLEIRRKPAAMMISFFLVCSVVIGTSTTGFWLCSSMEAIDRCLRGRAGLINNVQSAWSCVRDHSAVEVQVCGIVDGRRLSAGAMRSVELTWTPYDLPGETMAGPCHGGGPAFSSR